MLTVVVIFNLLIALMCLYVARRVWRLRRSLARAADVLTAAEQRTYRVLHGAPNAIIKGQLGTHQLRQRYQRLLPQLQQAQQAVALVSLVQSAWLGRSPARWQKLGLARVKGQK